MEAAATVSLDHIVEMSDYRNGSGFNSSVIKKPHGKRAPTARLTLRLSCSPRSPASVVIPEAWNKSSVDSSHKTSMTSSAVIIPRNIPDSSTTGRVNKSYRLSFFGSFFLVCRCQNFDNVVVHQTFDQNLRRCHEQFFESNSASFSSSETTYTSLKCRLPARRMFLSNKRWPSSPSSFLPPPDSRWT